MDVQQSGNKLEGGQLSELGGINLGRAILLIIIGFLIGISLKAQAIKTLTIGYDDYRLAKLKSDFQLRESEAANSQSQAKETVAPENGEQMENNNQPNVQ